MNRYQIKQVFTTRLFALAGLASIITTGISVGIVITAKDPIIAQQLVILSVLLFVVLAGYAIYSLFIKKRVNPVKNLNEKNLPTTFYEADVKARCKSYFKDTVIFVVLITVYNFLFSGTSDNQYLGAISCLFLIPIYFLMTYIVNELILVKYNRQH